MSCHVTATKTDRPDHEASQPSRPLALPSSNDLHSVQYNDGLHLAHSYEQRPFQGLPRTFSVWRVIP
jgi:hypothetical protein